MNHNSKSEICCNLCGNGLDLGQVLSLSISIHAGLQDQRASGIAALLAGEPDGHVGLR